MTAINLETLFPHHHCSPSQYISPGPHISLSFKPRLLNPFKISAIMETNSTTSTTTSTATSAATTTTSQRLAALRSHARKLQVAFRIANDARTSRLAELINIAEQHNDKVDLLHSEQRGFWDKPLCLRMVAVVINSQREVQSYHDESVRLEDEYLLEQEGMKMEERRLMRQYEMERDRRSSE